MGYHPRPLPLRVGLALLLTVLVPLPASTPARAAIAVLGEIGSGLVNGPSLTFNTTIAMPAGGSIIIVVSATSITGTAPTCSDSVNGSYQVDSTQGNSTAVVSVCSKHNVAATPAATLFTVTWPGASAASVLHAVALAATGLATAQADRTTGTGSGFLNGPALTTPLSSVTQFPNELLIGGFFVAVSPASANFVAGPNGTANNCGFTGTPTYTAFPGVGFGHSLWAEFCTVTAQAAYAARGTINGGSNYIGVLSTYAEASPTPTNTPTPTSTPTATPCILGDINCDGIVDIRDYGVWRQNFGHMAGAPPRAASSGPSPTSTATPTPRADRGPASHERGSPWDVLLRAVQALGITFPNEILLQITEVIQ